MFTIHRKLTNCNNALLAWQQKQHAFTSQGCSSAHTDDSEKPRYNDRCNRSSNEFEPPFSEIFQQCLAWTTVLAAAFQLTGARWQKNASLTPALSSATSGNAMHPISKMSRPLSSPNLLSSACYDNNKFSGSLLRCSSPVKSYVTASPNENCDEANRRSTSSFCVIRSSGQLLENRDVDSRIQLSDGGSVGYGLLATVVKDKSLLPYSCLAKANNDKVIHAQRRNVVLKESSAQTTDDFVDKSHESVNGSSKAQHQESLESIVANCQAVFYNMTGLELLRKKLFSEAFDQFSAASNFGYGPALYNLGQCYYRGIGTSSNINKAKEYWQKSAEAGHALASYQLGVLAIKNSCHTSAAKYLKVAADASVPEAIEFLQRSKAKSVSSKTTAIS